MTTPFDRLCAVARIKPREGEAFDAFAVRLTTKVNDATEKDWNSLGDGGPEQTWHNNTMMRLDERKQAKVAAKRSGKSVKEQEALAAVIDLPELDGFPYPDAEGTEAAEAEAAEADVAPVAETSSRADVGQQANPRSNGAGTSTDNLHSYTEKWNRLVPQAQGYGIKVKVHNSDFASYAVAQERLAWLEDKINEAGNPAA